MKNLLIKINNYKSDIIAYVSAILMILGTILPIIKLEGVSQSFISENGKLVLMCAIIGALLYLFKLGKFSFIPAIGSLGVLFVFYYSINDNVKVLNTLSEGSATYEIGFYLIIIGSILMICASIINFFDMKRNNKETMMQDETVNMEPNMIDQQFNELPSLNEVLDNRNIEQPQMSDTSDNNALSEQPQMPDTSDNNALSEQPIKEMSTQIKVKTVNGIEFICCDNCGSTIRKTSKKCFFCDAMIDDNKM